MDMGRRSVGALLMGFAVLAAAVVPQMGVRVVPGDPSATQVPAPPALGSCLLEPVSYEVLQLANGMNSLHPAVLGSCAGPHYGEVIELKADFPLLEWNPANPYPGMTDKQRDVLFSCDSGPSYLGLPSGTDGEVAGWTPVVSMQTALLAGDARQRAAGQRWAACVLLGTGDAGIDATIRDTYTGTLKNAFLAGTTPDSFGKCALGSLTQSAPTPCRDPHTHQLLGIKHFPPGQHPAASIQADCHRLAAQLTRMPDPSAGGRLRLLGELTRWDSQGYTIAPGQPHEPDETLEASCSVVTAGTARLTGSLLGIGARPLPITG